MSVTRRKGERTETSYCSSPNSAGVDRRKARIAQGRIRRYIAHRVSNGSSGAM